MVVTKKEYEELILHKKKWDVVNGITIVPLKVLEFEVTQGGKELKLSR